MKIKMSYWLDEEEAGDEIDMDGISELGIDIE